MRVAGRAKVDIFMLHPHGRVSDVQRRQMTTVLAPNVHNIAIDGSFDDAQAMVKAHVQRQGHERSRFGIAAVNSINWARLMAQVVYCTSPPRCSWRRPRAGWRSAVPTGNFGDVFAGYVAAQMGLPIERLIVATNINDILHRALSSGDHPAGTVDADRLRRRMDIQVSSNFERLLYDAGGVDGAVTMAQMKRVRGYQGHEADQCAAGSAAALFTQRSHRCGRDVRRDALGT